MKVRSIPAQITTVEDKIAGNLNLTQILLLMIPVFWLMVVYTIFPPYMEFSVYKFPLILIVGVTVLSLALRIKGKIILNWLTILLRYNTRPKYYLFNKNESHLRTMDVVSMDSTKRKSRAKALVKEHKVVSDISVSFADLVRFEGIIANPRNSFSIKSQKKGSLYVAFEQN